MTYAELVARIKEWTEDDSSEFSAQIDWIIQLAEIRIAREADLNTFRKTSTSLVTTVGADEVTAPSDMVTPRYVQLTASGQFLLPKDETYIREYNRSVTTATTPLYYSQFQNGDINQFLLGPTPDAAYALTIGYTYRPTNLSSTNTTTWLSNNIPDLLFYACLMECAVLDMFEERDRTRYTGLYERSLESARFEEQTRRRTDEYRTGVRGISFTPPAKMGS
jgi:hypothetical protein